MAHSDQTELTVADLLEGMVWNVSAGPKYGHYIGGDSESRVFGLNVPGFKDYVVVVAKRPAEWHMGNVFHTHPVSFDLPAEIGALAVGSVSADDLPLPHERPFMADGAPWNFHIEQRQPGVSMPDFVMKSEAENPIKALFERLANLPDQAYATLLQRSDMISGVGHYHDVASKNIMVGEHTLAPVDITYRREADYVKPSAVPFTQAPYQYLESLFHQAAHTEYEDKEQVHTLGSVIARKLIHAAQEAGTPFFGNPEIEPGYTLGMRKDMVQKTLQAHTDLPSDEIETLLTVAQNVKPSRPEKSAIPEYILQERTAVAEIAVVRSTDPVSKLRAQLDAVIVARTRDQDALSR